MTYLATKTLAAIDNHLEESQDSSFRRHLGASISGRPCARELWYTFRWAKKEKHQGRILRLFERGHLEENRFIKWLKSIGCEVWAVDDKGQQFKISDHMGHFGGSLDGVAKGIPDLPPNEPGLAEFKTHGDKSFRLFLTKKVFEAKFEHYVQMQIYMKKTGLKYALYMAINKNTDALYLEIIPYDKVTAERYLDRARMIIFSTEAPPRINNSPGWWQCSYCTYKGICHNGGVGAINCRTCALSTPVEKAKWHCARYPEEVVFRPHNLTLFNGCAKHIFLPDMIGGAQLLRTDPNKNWVELEVNGKAFLHGPAYVTSQTLIKYPPSCV